MIKEKIVILFAFGFALVGCTSTSESDISSNPNPNPSPGTITYTNTIKSIITDNCISCHGPITNNGASAKLDTYSRVKTATESNGLIDRISKNQGDSGLMPKNGTRLSQATIDMVISWKNNGYPE